jgi:hypothetical protein
VTEQGSPSGGVNNNKGKKQGMVVGAKGKQMKRNASQGAIN